MSLPNEPERMTRAEWQSLHNKARAERMVCKHCGLPHLDTYMVHNALWQSVFGEGRGLLHLQCFEEKLGRRLTLEDFTPAIVNDPIRFGFRMADTLGITPPVSVLPYWSRRKVSPRRFRRGEVKPFPTLRIGADFDETIAEKWSGTWDVAKFDMAPMPGAIDWIRTLLDDGHQVVIYSARLSAPQSHVPMVQWFARNGLEKQHLRQLGWWTAPGKPWVDVYVDDRAYRFTGTFPDLNQLRELAGRG